MDAAVEVALPASVQVARLMGSAEGFGGGGSSGSVVVREVPIQTEGVCGVGAQKDEVCAGDASKPAFWSKVPNSELCVEVCQSSSLRPEDASKNNDLGIMSPPSLTIDLESRLLIKKSNRVMKSNVGCTKRPAVVQLEVSKSKHRIRDVNGISPEIASSLGSCNIPEKIQLVKQKNSSNFRRGEKRNNKVLKNRSDSFSLKNGLVGFNSAAGGNDFLGVYGLKPDVFDITKYINELSLDELLDGSCKFPSITKDKGKKAANSNNNLLQSVRKACSILQTEGVSQAQKCAEGESICIGNISSGAVAATAGELVSNDQRECCTVKLPSSDKVEECAEENKTSNSIDDSQLYLPMDILERLALPPPKDLDLLLSDAGRISSSSKTSADLRTSKSVSNRNGLIPFPWSHSFSGHNRLGGDSVKPSASRPICHGKWVKIKNTTILPKGTSDFLTDFETLTFDQRIIPKASLKSEGSTSGAPTVELVLPSPGAPSTLKVHAEEDSPTYAAAQALCGMATDSPKGSPSAAVKLLKRPSHMTMKPCKLTGIDKSDKSFDPHKSTRPINPGKTVHNGSPLKKPRMSADGTSASISHTDSVRKGPPNWSGPQSIRSPPRKLFRDPNTGVNFVKPPYTMKPPSSSQQKPRKAVPMKWSRPV